ncbi:hypothetical protein P153DRAFT_380894 [Dothidotthia symphoricarpi CBS 119687]|uniref:Uncharacterized protein n=1 Tax=Dothidotthia symphoricarpi CBS 119687 TaxID=1392245 RepID=A0A6A6AS88_9PLEO|nr:uncharacterized protein P153DRAFT_380894 [Dothidotthia symphoricarpi CBS 119687]KAF2133707.1 hypothetical protein P153DRAFT_380894 [Dothidotthia symphoricarpi CBS 119687]
MAAVPQPSNLASPQHFEQINHDLEAHLQDISIISIQHIDHTSIPSLAAKPTIDIAIAIIVAQEMVQPALHALMEQHFEYLGEQGVTGYHILTHPKQSPRHNIYICTNSTSTTKDDIPPRKTTKPDTAIHPQTTSPTIPPTPTPRLLLRDFT